MKIRITKDDKNRMMISDVLKRNKFSHNVFFVVKLATNFIN
jgi:hypothetical protein